MRQVKWEYRVVQLGPSSSHHAERVLNELGEQGWELTGFQPGHRRAGGGEGLFFFKRPRSGFADA